MSFTTLANGQKIVDGATGAADIALNDNHTAIDAHLGSAHAAGLYVAAADTPANLLSLATYACDGVGDNLEIQAAIDADGGSVNLLPGTYSIDAPIVLPSNAKLLGHAAVLAPTDTIASNAVTRDGVNITAVIRNATVQSHRTAVAVSDASASRSAIAAGGMLIHNVGDESVYIYDGDQTATVGQDKSNAQLLAISGVRRLAPGASYFLPADQSDYTVVCVDGESSEIYEYAESSLIIEGLTIDYSGVTSDLVHHAGIWIDACYGALVRDVRVHDVLANPGGSSYRQFGVLFIDCHSSGVEGGEFLRCGYEGIGLRGHCYDCSAVGSICGNNGIHMAQVAGWFYDGGVYGSGKANLFDRLRGGGVLRDRRGTQGDGVDIIIHGDVADGGAAGNQIINCVAGTITLTDSQRDTLVMGNAVRGQIRHSLINDDATQEGMRIIGNTIEGDDLSGGYMIDVSANDVSLAGFEIAHNTGKGIGGRAGSWYFDVSGDGLDAQHFVVQNNDLAIREYAWRMDIASGANNSRIRFIWFTLNRLVYPSATGAGGGVRCEVSGGAPGSPSEISHVHVEGNTVVGATNRGAFVLCSTNADSSVHDVVIAENKFDDDDGGSTACVTYLDEEVTNLSVNNNRFLGTALTRVFAGPLSSAVVVDYIGNDEDTAPLIIDGTTGGNLTVNSGDWDYS